MRLLPPLLALCALAGCKSSPPPPPREPPRPAASAGPAVVAEVEPNDFQRPQLVPARAEIHGSIAPGPQRTPDDDWYRVESGPAMVLRVELKPAGAPLEAWLEVLDGARSRLVRTRAEGDAGAAIAAVACSDACFVRVTGSRPAPYVLSIAAGPRVPGSEVEPNDRASDANELVPDQPLSGTFLSVEDEDWYRVVAAPRPGQLLRVELSGVEGIRPELEVRSLDGALLATFRAARAGEGIFVRDLPLSLPPPVPAPDAGLAFLPPREVGVDAGPAGDAGDAGPPDAAVAGDAGPPDAAIAGDAGPPDAAIALDSGAGSDAAMAGDAGGGALPDAGLPDGGAAPVGYYLTLRSAPIGGTKRKPVRGANPLVPYTLLAALEQGPPDVEREPNDDPQHASPLGDGGTATGWLSPAGDADWYRVHADAPSVARVEVSALEHADVELAVYGPVAAPGGKPPLLARVNEGGAREGELLPSVGLPAGDSFVLVQPAARKEGGRQVRDGEDPSSAYHLTVVLSADDGAQEREPNDDLAHAQEVTLPARVRGTIWPKRDVDLFAFAVGEGHAPVSVRLSAVRGVDLQLRLLELRGGASEIIGSADAVRGEGEEQLLSVPLKPGRYAVEVSSPQRDASATEGYVLSIQ